MDRREFLMGAAGLSLSAQVWSAPSAQPKLLVVMLRGGYDSTNFLAPVGVADYHEARPNIALKASGKGAALPIDSVWGLHPSAGLLHARYKKGEALIIPYSGNVSAPRSHFEAQDLMEAGGAPGARLNASSGWMGRLMEALGANARGGGAISFTSNLPLSMKGKSQVPNIAGRFDKPMDERKARMMNELYKGSDLEEAAAIGMKARERVAKSMQADGEMAAASRGAVDAGKGLSGQFEKMAKVMRGDPLSSVAFADVGGWDTHVNQGGAEGALAGKIEALCQALDAYAVGMGSAWRDATVLVFSEFGRTFRENGNKGTDHGHGTIALALGGGIKGGRLGGRVEAPGFGMLHEKRDMPVFNDYRAVASQTLAHMYALGAKDLDYILPGAPKTARFIF